MKRNGSGAVTVSVVLDPDAVRTAEAGGGKLEDRVRLSDLAAAHWTVSQWQRALDGSATITATKQFSRPSQVTEIIGEISGPNGPLRDFRATRKRELLKTEYRVSGTASRKPPLDGWISSSTRRLGPRQKCRTRRATGFHVGRWPCTAWPMAMSAGRA